MGDKVTSKVSDAVSANLNLVNEKTKKYQEEFIRLIKNNKVIVFILIVILIISLITYRVAPKPRQYIVNRNITRHIDNRTDFQDIYSFLDSKNYIGARGYLHNTFWNDTSSANTEETWLTLCDFHIASSAKSYLLLSKYYDYCSYDSITYTLEAGARFIELDIYRQGLNEDENIPVVTNGVEVGEWKLCINTLCLKKCLEAIKKSGLNNTIYKSNNNPLILYLNININSTLKFDTLGKNPTEDKYGDFRFFNKIAEIIYEVFGNDYLLSGKYSLYNQSSSIHKNPIHLENIYELKNKLIIMSNVTGSCTNLGEYINILCPKNYKDNENIYNMNSFSNTELDGYYDIKTLINKNKNQLTHVYEQSDKNSLKNYVSGTALSRGCQLVSMYYQINDNNMSSYMNSKWGQIGNTPVDTTPPTDKYGFNKCSFVLKNPVLRNSLQEVENNTLGEVKYNIKNPHREPPADTS